MDPKSQAPRQKPTKQIKRTKPGRPKKCHLLELPAEIRNYIVELVLRNADVFSSSIEIAMDYRIPYPPLARTCRQFRTETLSLFYGQNAVILGDLDFRGEWDDRRRWLKTVAKHIPFVQELQMMFCDYHRTWLVIEVKPDGEGCCASVRINMDEPGDNGELCKATKKWSEIEDIVRETISSSTGRHGLTAGHYILAGDLMVDTHMGGRHYCEQEDFESEEDDDEEQ